jgi:hypothetical protein
MKRKMWARRSAIARAPAICIMYICANVIDWSTTSSAASPSPSCTRREPSFSVAARTTSPIKMGRSRLTHAITTSVTSDTTT